MITVSHGAGLHSQKSDADDFWSHDMDKQWRKLRIQFLKRRCCPNATGISPTRQRVSPRRRHPHLRLPFTMRQVRRVPLMTSPEAEVAQDVTRSLVGHRNLRILDQPAFAFAGMTAAGGCCDLESPRADHHIRAGIDDLPEVFAVLDLLSSRWVSPRIRGGSSPLPCRDNRTSGPMSPASW